MIKDDLKNQDTRVSWVEFYFDASKFPRYRVEVEWSDGLKFAFNVYDSPYWCDRLYYLFGLRWKPDLNFFSLEHCEEADSKRYKLLGEKMGIVTGSNNFQYLIYL